MTLYIQSVPGEKNNRPEFGATSRMTSRPMKQYFLSIQYMAKKYITVLFGVNLQNSKRVNLDSISFQEYDFVVYPMLTCLNAYMTGKLKSYFMKQLNTCTCKIIFILNLRFC